MSQSSKRELIFSFNKKDFRVDWYRASKSGGQNVNKNSTACRITHIESGLASSCQEHKSAYQNKKKAFRKLVKLLMAHYLPEEQKERGDLSAKNTRTYNECTDRVKDHETGEIFSYRQTIAKGDMGEIIEERRLKWVK